MTFEEFLEHCTFSMRYIRPFKSKAKFVVMVFFDNPNGKTWVHAKGIDADVEAAFGPKTVKKYVARNLYFKLKADKVI